MYKQFKQTIVMYSTEILFWVACVCSFVCL